MLINNKVFYNKLFLLINIFFFINIYSYSINQIYVSPINKTILYDNFIDNELYPFIYSKQIIPVDNKSTFKILEEYDGLNSLLGDILKVEIVDGYYKGRVGYLLEERVRLTTNLKKDRVFVFFKDDTLLKDSNHVIKRDTKCEIIESNIAEGIENLTLKIETAKSDNQYIITNNKNYLHYIINESSEILYHLRRGFKIIKVIDTNTLFPVDNAISNNYKTDDSGIIYIDDKSKNIVVKKNGYTDGIIELNDNQQIYLCFIEPLDYIDYYDDRGSIYKKDQYKFEIKSRNNAVSGKIGIKILSNNNLSIFNYPLSNFKNIIIRGGFYLKNSLNNADFICSIFMEEHVKLIHFDLKRMKWEDIQIFKNNVHNCYDINNLSDGYYLFYIKNNVENKNIRLNIDFKYNSRIFYRNKDSSIAGYSINNDISVFKDNYELIYFNPENPYYPGQKLINIDEKVNKIKLNIEKNGFENILNNNDLENKYNSGLPSTYNGTWYRKDLKKKNRFIRENERILEYLGDMELTKSNKLLFTNMNYKIEGYIELINKNQFNIHINYVSGIVENKDQNAYFIINPSLFNSQIMISALYKYYVGVLQISFNGFLFERKNYYENTKSDNNLIKIDTPSFITSSFPKSENESNYSLYYTQEKTVD